MNVICRKTLCEYSKQTSTQYSLHRIPSWEKLLYTGQKLIMKIITCIDYHGTSIISDDIRRYVDQRTIIQSWPTTSKSSKRNFFGISIYTSDQRSQTLWVPQDYLQYQKQCRWKISLIQKNHTTALGRIGNQQRIFAKRSQCWI